MTPLSTSPSPVARHTRDELAVEEETRLELLEDLPARLELDALAQIMRLHQEGKTAKTIGTRMSLDWLVVILELNRELHRHANDPQEKESGSNHQDDASGLPRLTRREWNRLAKGTHVPNQPVRVMFETVLRLRPDLSERSVLAEARVADVTHAKRLLGIKPYPKAKRPTQTISCARAASITRALGRGPREVPGL